MVRPSRLSRRKHPVGVRLQLESLETRDLLNATPWPGLSHPLVLAAPNETLDQALDLGDLSAAGRGEVIGTIGNGPAGAADVGWYRFTLDQPANLHLATLDHQAGSSFDAVLSLYNSDIDDSADLLDPLGPRLLAQDVAPVGGDASISRLLAPGTYYVAVSGAGNRSFNPFLADSGFDGSTGFYGLQLTASTLSLPADAGPVLLSADPAPGSVLNSSPLVVRLDFSAPLGSLDLQPELTHDGQPVLLLGSNLDTTGTELQLFPAAALPPGTYQVSLPAEFSAGGAALPPATFTFQVNGIEGRTTPGPADDTAAGAHDLGDVAGKGLVQATGAIGDDPAYDPSSPNPFLTNPASDVDLYHFQVTGPGRYQFLAEVFAGRVGSGLNPGLSLFRLDPSTRQLDFVSGNDDTLDPATEPFESRQPLLTDPALFVGLTAGDYYVAVSSSGNVPDAALNELPGTGGIFDPNVSHSGQGGFSTGNYVLNLAVQPDNLSPRVLSTSPAAGASLADPPTQLVVRFSEPVNLQELNYQSEEQTSQGKLDSVFVLGPDGVRYSPWLGSYDPTTNQATFVMSDRLPAGTSELHLSGPLGLTDLAGNPLVGNTASGDYVVSFKVAASGAGSNPLQRSDQEPNNSLAHPQNLGPLFPSDLASVVQGQPGVAVTRDFTANPHSAPADRADYYQFQILQCGTFLFALDGSGLPPGTVPTLTDAAGQPVATQTQKDGHSVSVSLNPGTYVVSVGGWTPAQAPRVTYQLRISTLVGFENPTPLTDGPAPILRLHLADAPLLTPAPTPTPATAPAPSLVTENQVSTGSLGTPSPTSVPTSSPPAPALASLETVNPTSTEERSPAILPVAAPVSPAAATTPAVTSTPQTSSSLSGLAGALSSLALGPVGGIRSGEGGEAAPLFRPSSQGATTFLAGRTPSLPDTPSGADSGEVGAAKGVSAAPAGNQSPSPDAGTVSLSVPSSGGAADEVPLLAPRAARVGSPPDSEEQVIDTLFALGDWTPGPLVPPPGPGPQTLLAHEANAPPMVGLTQSPRLPLSGPVVLALAVTGLAAVYGRNRGDNFAGTLSAQVDLGRAAADSSTSEEATA